MDEILFAFPTAKTRKKAIYMEVIDTAMPYSYLMAWLPMPSVLCISLSELCFLILVEIYFTLPSYAFARIVVDEAQIFLIEYTTSMLKLTCDKN